ncbi:hypothetical protein F2Q70_00013861 [Brassica cretica]|uniref:Uncharacterized protein n=1 Tax=Brassica cretica TaxID=69181 RepID=A0A8S9MEL3_BRACR|nr:hypothetical protein F2Q70_00013861 [Brassica cretica]KAF3552270.1 hypothetical protein DY000_02010575 [Brassica cretica]
MPAKTVFKEPSFPREMPAKQVLWKPPLPRDKSPIHGSQGRRKPAGENEITFSLLCERY